MSIINKITCSLLITSTLAFAHGDAAPQKVDTQGLPEIGYDVYTNPFSGNEKAIEVGKTAYNQNCARCHGLEGKSGGIAPDLRLLTDGDDEYFAGMVRAGVVRNDNVYMPPFPDDIIPNSALWAIYSYLETLPEED
ncbi:cytochrome c-550 PedF [Halarcobacter mediterraneus]|uniref:Cytochrome c-550 PedF n=1 Tax=Halarcobacter mediterraneus TaxID=2023153 RepID=A0A4Q1ATH8_9BACT|nr:cytochrome c-550 PedF [Halarcobacter mediterraneus]RXK13182.1 cytochrome c-550 PedF [Halarcobacter mediterraneus]